MEGGILSGFVEIEVCGESVALPEITCGIGERLFRFTFDQGAKQGRHFQLGAFFSKAVLSDAALRYPRAQRFAVLTESPIDGCYAHLPEIVRRFPLVFTHQADLLRQGGPFRPLMFGTNWVSVVDDATTASALAQSFVKRDMVSFVGSLEHPDTGAYRFRREVAQLALSRSDVDCFGRGIRPIQGKREALESYRFSIAMENAASDDYFSEKLVDCILTDCVPLYFGWPSIAEHLDPRGFLTFDSLESLGSLLDRLTPELYEQMRPYAIANKQAVIQRRWHSHQGLLARLSEQLPEPMLASRPLGYRRMSRLEAAARRIAAGIH